MQAGERMKNRILGKQVDRMPVIEWAPWWDKTIDRWHTEGLPVQLRYGDIQSYFGLDKCLQHYFHVHTEKTPQAPEFGHGIMRTREDYLSLRDTLFPNPETLYTGADFALMEKQRQQGDTVHFCTLDGFFWFPRTLFGIEPHLYSFYDYPELLKEMCGDYLAWLEKTVAFIKNNYCFDFLTFAEDMSYNGGPMLSKDCFDEFLAPYYKQIIPQIKACGIPVIIDSDGDITKAVDWYSEVGADGMLPLERQAGVDVSLYVQKHPEMAFIGHFDKMCMKYGEQAMRAEFERILPSARKGRIIISVDHQTPPDVSMDNYRIYVSLLKEYAQKAVN